MLATANADNVNGRLVAILEFLLKDAMTKSIIDELANTASMSDVFKEDDHRRIIASTPEQIAFAGYTLMAESRTQSFWGMCANYNIRGPYNASNVDEITRIGLEEYIYPFLDYIEDKRGETTVTSIIDGRIAAVLSDDLKRTFPAIQESLHHIATEFSRPAAEGRWQNVGNSCREALKATVRALVDSGRITVPPDVKLGDIKHLAENLAAASMLDADSRRTLPKLIAAVWDHAASMTHRPATTRDEAARLFVWTCLAIYELMQTE
jgi:hypothetical protein